MSDEIVMLKEAIDYVGSICCTNEDCITWCIGNGEGVADCLLPHIAKYYAECWVFQVEDEQADALEESL